MPVCSGAAYAKCAGGLALAVLAALRGQTEVDELGTPVCEHHDVLRVDVPVDHADPVRRGERAGHVDHQPDRL